MTKLKVLFATAVGALSIGLFAGTAHAEPTPTAEVVTESPSPNPGSSTLELTTKTITPGAFCGKKDHWRYDQSKDGDWYRCSPDGKVWRWLPTSSPAPKEPTKKPTTKPSQSKTPAATSNGPELPRTGSNTPVLVAGIGSGIIVLGGMLVIFSLRTRKVRVETPDDGR